MRTGKKEEINTIKHVPDAAPDKDEADDDAEIAGQVAQGVSLELLVVTHVIHRKSVAWRAESRCDSIVFAAAISMVKPT